MPDRPTKFAGVFAQPLDTMVRWRDNLINVFISWASHKNTAGANPAQDRAAQLEWRAGCRAIGVGYFDMPNYDWRVPATPAMIAADLADPWLYGWVGPDEANIKPDGKTWRVSLIDYTKFWAPLMAADPKDTKRRFINFSGTGLTSAWGFYDASDVVPYCQAPTDVSMDWYPKNMEPERYPNQYVGRGLRMLGRVAPPKPKWAFLECSDQQLASSNGGRAPTLDDMEAQYQALLAEQQNLVGLIWFPQAPKPSAAHLFDNSDDAHRAKIKEINSRFLGGLPVTTVPAPVPLPVIVPPVVAVPSDPNKVLRDKIDALSRDVADLKATLKSGFTGSFKLA